MKHRIGFILLVLLFLAGCARSKDVVTIERTVNLHQQPPPRFDPFVLSCQQGESFALSWLKPVTIGALTLTLQKIADSRCPKDVLCIWAGIAVADVQLQDSTGASVYRTLSLHNMERVELGAKAYQVTLRDIAPYPRAANLNQIEKEARVSVTPL
ncbi:hypothetical protein [Rufibacter hautae]|uniref:Lipoprotein n=1 Tax=Rufibacter hautae TaxID=2595005 RepID=A0A5B6THN1_9BACT|nr:hypothetical protein [Rufibacter hautae]KAA3440184.1 hypothetical protein FOA19_05835 [Rufibacter hautae]